MTGKLRPCPFCGAHGFLVGENTGRVQCEDCCAATDLHQNDEAAMKAWNRRAYELAPPPAVLPVVDPNAVASEEDRRRTDLLERSVTVAETEHERAEDMRRATEEHSAFIREHAARQTVAMGAIAAALVGPEAYRRALDVALMTGRLTPIAGDICDLSDAIASERERRGPK